MLVYDIKQCVSHTFTTEAEAAAFLRGFAAGQEDDGCGEARTLRDVLMAEAEGGGV